ncbi:DNA polymerase V [Rhynchospora pubera]|uniref:DNA polymerase V n=1 Tax=Rhynchospora pubera TaxID=906938 RepID=A0AAV8F6U4_9POAL|nr:DNA polymerase V [Rhynchospora pubera]
MPDLSGACEGCRGNQKSESKSESNTEEEQNPESKLKQETKEPVTSVASTSLTQPGLHLDLFRGLSSQESSVREEAAERLVRELRDVQRSYEESNGENGEQGDPVKLEAEKDDGMENCAPSLRYAIRRFIRGVSSSREFARQGFALALAAVIAEIHAIKLDSLMKFIVEELEVSSGMKGQEAKDNLLGRLFAYASIARSSRISEQWMSDKNSSIVKDFVAEVTSLVAKKRYLSEPAVSVILDLVNKLQVLLEEAQKSEGARILNEIEPNDLASYFTRFVETVSSIPSVSLFTALGDEDDKAFKKLLKMESKLSNEERKVSPGTDSSRMHAMRFLLMQLLLQILLHPGEFHEAAIDLTICCKKAFSFLSQGNSEEEEEEEEGSAPQFMDVLVDTFLSLLPHSSGPLNYAIEQVFMKSKKHVTA